MINEDFRVSSDFPNYEVSNFGRIRTLSRLIRYSHSVTKKEHFRTTETRFLKSYYNGRTGYEFVQLRNKDGKVKNMTIHRLVALYFLPPVINANDLVVNHKDGNKLNNLVSNLEWCTNEYNHQHATLNRLKASGERVASSKLNSKNVLAIKSLLQLGLSHSKIAKAFFVSRATVTMINTNKIWKNINALTGKELTLTTPEGGKTKEGE